MGLMTIATGFTGSLLFVFLITAVGNLEKTVFGNNFQTKLGEVVFCILMAMSAAGTVHRFFFKVSATTCLLFSIGQAYALNKMAQEVHGAGVAATTASKEEEIDCELLFLSRENYLVKAFL